MEQLLAVQEEIKNLKNQVQGDSLSKQDLIDNLTTLEIVLQDLAKREEKAKEEKAKAKEEEDKAAKKELQEDEEKGLSTSIKNVKDDLDKIDNRIGEARAEVNSALDEIRWRTTAFTIVATFLFGAQVVIDPEQYWVLIIILLIMLFGSIAAAWKVFLDLWRISKEFRDLSERQDILYEVGRYLIEDLKSAEAVSELGGELKAEFLEFNKSIRSQTRRQVAEFSWSYWINFAFFAAFAVMLPILLFLNLGAIAKRDAQCPKDAAGGKKS